MSHSAKVAEISNENEKQKGNPKIKPQNASSATMTPMMMQFSQIKAEYSDSLLFYRMGDFYELFFEDAVIASKALGIQLTKRGKHQGQEIPMCGVPFHSSDDYLHRLIKQGYRVAVCEQTEDPAEAKKRGAKSVVKREVVRVVTPGTLTEDSLLTSTHNNFLTSIFKHAQPSTNEKPIYAIASLDISTGEFLISEVNEVDLLGEIIRFSPKEILLSDKHANENIAILLQENSTLTPIPNSYFNSQSGEHDLKNAYNVNILDGIGTFTKGELAAIGALLKYIELTQINQKPVLRIPKRQETNSVMVIDAATRTNLELVKSINGEKQGSLLAAIDKTITGAGSRELSKWLSGPLRNTDKIRKRQDVIEYFLNETAQREHIQKTMRGLADIARAFSRLSLERGGPRDMGVIRDCLNIASKLSQSIKSDQDLVETPVTLQVFIKNLMQAKGKLAETLNQALNDDLPFLKRDGDFVKPEYSQELDEVRTLRDKSQKIIAQLQAKYAEQTNIKSLKIRHNNVLGYFVEVTATQGKPLLEAPLNETFIHRQTLANAFRLTTTELNDIQTQIHSSAQRALSIEQGIFADLIKEILANKKMLITLSETLAELDVYCSLATIAEEQNYTRPNINDSLDFEITQGRHPIVDIALQKSKQTPFIENDCYLSSDDKGTQNEDNTSGCIWLLTGPNMAGKSTFLRQNALITILAQMGSYVPAKSANIGIVDRLFSRVGASDDLARGRSTFMVEMIETATILNQATQRSFVILDEIGRGTATFDGLSIAWATVEYLHDQIKCRSIFATHYHELTELTKKLFNACNVTLEVKEWQDEIIFLHKVTKGAADRSYGVQVAKLAGLPKPVTKRAFEILQHLENTEQKPQIKSIIEDLPLFANSFQENQAVPIQEDCAIKSRLDQINPDELTPKAALDMLYELKSLKT